MKPPDRLSGTNPLVGWLNRLRDAVMANEVTSVSNGRLEAGRGGTQIICGGKGGAGQSPLRLKMKSATADYLVCRSWDGTTEGSTDIYVAKPYKLRESTPADTGYTQTYSGTHPNRVRTKTISGASETQVVTPIWIADEEVWATYVSDTGVTVTGPPEVKVTYTLSFDSRAWAKQTGT